MMDNVNADLVLVDVLAINAKPTSGAIPMLSANVRIPLNLQIHIH